MRLDGSSRPKKEQARERETREGRGVQEANKKGQGFFWTEGNAFHKIVNEPTPVTFCSPSYVFTRTPPHTFFPFFATNQLIAFVGKGHKVGFLYSLFSRNNWTYLIRRGRYKVSVSSKSMEKGLPIHLGMDTESMHYLIFIYTYTVLIYLTNVIKKEIILQKFL